MSSWVVFWLVIVGVCLIAEMATPGLFILIPFAIGGVVGGIAALADGSVGLQWTLFVIVSVVASFGFIPLRKRLDSQSDQSPGIGSRRLLNQSAIVIAQIGPGEGSVGTVRVGREEWNAISQTGGALTAGTSVEVVEVRGTSVVVINHPPITSTG